MSKESEKYHKNMTKVFKSANTNHEVNIERHLKNQEKEKEKEDVVVSKDPDLEQE